MLINQFRNSKTAVIWLCMAHFVNDVYTGFLNPLMPFIATELNFSMGVATIILAITQICSNLFQPIFGFFADNILKRFFIFWGLILASIFIPLAPSAKNIYLLTISMILGCLGSSFFHPQSSGFINLFSKNNHSNNMGIFISLGSLGFAIGPLLAAFIVQSIGLNKMYYTSCLGLFLVSIMFLFVPKLSLAKKQAEHKYFTKTFKEIFSISQINYLMIISMMKSLVTNSSCILLPFLWKSMGYSAFYIGFALFIFVSSGAIGSFISPYFEKQFGSKPIIYFSMCATLPIMLCFALTYQNHPTLSLSLFAFMGFTTMLAQPITLVWAQKVVPQYRSIVAGLINGFCWGIVALCLSFIGTVAQKIGILNVLIFLTIIPIPATYFVKKLKETT